MRASELIQYLESVIPPTCACDWDNVGLLVGKSDKEVNSIYIALDATDEVVADAAAKKCDFLLTHHPLLFHSIKKINDKDFIGRRILSLIQEDISYYAMHTSFDAAPGGMADMAALLLGLESGIPMEVMSDELETPWGIGKTGNLEKDYTLEELCGLVKERFALKHIILYPAADLETTVKRVAICPGSGRSMLEAAKNTQAQVLITGDIGHHEGIDANAMGISIIDAGHFGLEKIFIPIMAEKIQEEFNELTIFMAPSYSPCRIL